MQWVLLGSNFFLASCAVWAAITARSTLKALRRTLAAPATRSLQQLDSEITALSDALSSMQTTQRRLSSRVGMQDLRARRRGDTDGATDEPTDPAQRKAWLRKQLQSGKLRVVRDNQPAGDRGEGTPTANH